MNYFVYAASSAPTISSVLGDLGTIFQTVIGWVGDVATAVLSSPFLFILVGIPVALVGIGIFRRLMNLR